MRPTLPKTGNDDALLREHLTKLSVWKVLLLHGSYEHTQDEIAARLERIGVKVAAEFIPRLYYLAIEDAQKASGKK